MFGDSVGEVQQLRYPEEVLVQGFGGVELLRIQAQDGQGQRQAELIEGGQASLELQQRTADIHELGTVADVTPAGRQEVGGAV